MLIILLLKCVLQTQSFSAREGLGLLQRILSLQRIWMQLHIVHSHLF